MDALTVFFNDLWTQYIQITPQAQAIHDLFSQKGESLVNDHVAFRTFSHSPISIDALQTEVLALGYEYLDSYHFENKKLDARCYVHPQCPTKIFISELLWQDLSEPSQKIINGIIKQIDEISDLSTSELLYCGRLWNLPSYQDYQALLKESEYAAWLSVWGLRANHFTIFVNYLKNYQSLAQVVKLLQQQGYSLNSLGGHN